MSGARGSGSRFFGWVLITAGGLVALLCGTCTLTFGGPAAFDMISCQIHPPAQESCNAAYGAGPLIIIIALVIGGGPTGAGIAAIVIGLRLLRRPPPPPPPMADVWRS